MKVYITASLVSVLAVLASLYLRERLVVGLACVVLAAIGAYAVGRCSTRKGYGPLHMGVALNIVVVLPVVIAATNFPLRGAFAFVAEDMNGLADAVECGEKIKLPQRVGIFTIYETGVRGQTQYFITSQSGYDWEVEGLVRDPDGDGYNTWSETMLGGDWRYMSED